MAEYETQYLQLLIGQLQGRVSSLEQQVQQQTELLREMNKTLNTATGGWRTLVAMGTAGATIGGLVVALIQMLRGG